jgi:hypothetical protein
VAFRARTARFLRAALPDLTTAVAGLLIAAGLALSPLPFLAPIWVGVALLYVVRTGGST